MPKLTAEQITQRNLRRDENMCGRAEAAIKRHGIFGSSDVFSRNHICVSIGNSPQIDFMSEGKYPRGIILVDLTATRRAFKYFPSLLTGQNDIILDAKKVDDGSVLITVVEREIKYATIQELPRVNYSLGSYFENYDDIKRGENEGRY